MKTSASPVIGIDVASRELVLCDGKISRLANTPAAVRACLRRVPQSVLLVCEATGGYERLLVAEAHALGLAIHVANPRRVRDFARSLGRLEKTDPVDAEVIRRYGEAVRPAPTPRADPAQAQLRELVDLRHDLSEEHRRWSNRLAHATALTRTVVARRLRTLEREMTALERQIERHLAAHPPLQDKAQTLCLVPGVGLTTAAVVLAHLAELGQLNRREAAKLAGLAPLNHDSGTYRGHAHIAHGRAPLRKALYCAALVAARWNDDLRTFYQRLRANGKPAKLALVAVARKLLLILNSIIKDSFPLTS
jgi:transposase